MYTQEIRELLIAHHEPVHPDRTGSFLDGLFFKPSREEVAQKRTNQLIELFLALPQTDVDLIKSKEKVNEFRNQANMLLQDPLIKEPFKLAIRKTLHLLFELGNGCVYTYSEREIEASEHLSFIKERTISNLPSRLNEVTFQSDLARGLIKFSDASGLDIEVNMERLTSEASKQDGDDEQNRVLEKATGDKVDPELPSNANLANMGKKYLGQGLYGGVLKEIEHAIKFSQNEKNQNDDMWECPFNFGKALQVTCDKENKTLNVKLKTAIAALRLSREGPSDSVYYLCSKTNAMRKTESGSDRYEKLAKEFPAGKITPIVRIEGNIMFKFSKETKGYIGEFDAFRVIVNTPELSLRKGHKLDLSLPQHGQVSNSPR